MNITEKVMVHRGAVGGNLFFIAEQHLGLKTSLNLLKWLQ